MRSLGKCYKYLIVLVYLWLASCSVVEERAKKSVPLGLITTPATYYSTPKARYLGERYSGNLDRLVEQIIRNPKTANLQFANNIASIGGIGFFTHSAVRVPDERYLEVILATPETFETPGEFSSKLDRVFSLYGTELLSLLSADAVIYQEKQVSGYGLNLSWRKIAADTRGPRVTLERAIVYFPKEKVRGFLDLQMSRNELFEQAVIFAVEEDSGPALVSFRAPERRQDFRPPIHEENLAATKLHPEPKLKTPAQATALPTPPVPSSPVSGGQKALPEVPGQDLKGDPPAPAALARPEPLPRAEASSEAEPAIVETGDGSVAETKPTVSPTVEAKPVERAELKESARPVQAKKPSGDVGFVESKKEAQPESAPAKAETRAETIEVARAKSPADPPGGEAKVREQVKQPADVPSEVPGAPPPIPPVTPKAEEPAAVAPVMPKSKEPVAVAPVRPKAEEPLAVAPATPKTEEPAAVTSQEESGAAATIPAPPEREEKISPDAHEQVALLRTPPSEPAIGKKPLARPLPKPLEGFVIQVGFGERVKAQRWAESMERRGYAVSVTEVGTGSVRVRVGNFGARDEAERRLQSFREDGLTGIVINLPQAYRPQVVESQSGRP